jgi:hypothetical protein
MGLSIQPLPRNPKKTKSKANSMTLKEINKMKKMQPGKNKGKKNNSYLNAENKMRAAATRDKMKKRKKGGR